jgi:hypothetical protein
MAVISFHQLVRLRTAPLISEGAHSPSWPNVLFLLLRAAVAQLVGQYMLQARDERVHLVLGVVDVQAGPC